MGDQCRSPCLIGQVLARILRCARRRCTRLHGRHNLSVRADALRTRRGIDDGRVGICGERAKRLGFRRDGIIRDGLARGQIGAFGHRLRFAHQAAGIVGAWPRVDPQDAENHRCPRENQRGIPLRRCHPADRIDAALADDFVAFRCWIAVRATRGLGRRLVHRVHSFGSCMVRSTCGDAVLVP